MRFETLSAWQVSVKAGQGLCRFVTWQAITRIICKPGVLELGLGVEECIAALGALVNTLHSNQSLHTPLAW